MEYGGGTSAECDYILHRTVIPCMGSHAGIFRTKFTSWRTNIFLRFILCSRSQLPWPFIR